MHLQVVKLTKRTPDKLNDMNNELKYIFGRIVGNCRIMKFGLMIQNFSVWIVHFILIRTKCMSPKYTFDLSEWKIFNINSIHFYLLENMSQCIEIIVVNCLATPSYLSSQRIHRSHLHTQFMHPYTCTNSYTHTHMLTYMRKRYWTCHFEFSVVLSNEHVPCITHTLTRLCHWHSTYCTCAR